MKDHTTPHVNVTELVKMVRAVDPRVVLVAPRVLRRILKHDRELIRIGLQVPHRKTYVIERQRLLPVADPEDLGLSSEAEVPDPVILLPRPDPEWLARWSAGHALVKYWRLLFHARVHLVFREQLLGSRLTDDVVRARIQRIGQTQFDEVRTVLAQENYLLPPASHEEVYEEFAAVYLELRHFAPHLLAYYFPTIHDLAAVDAVLAQDVEAAGLLAATRPDGAPDPETLRPRPTGPAPALPEDEEEAMPTDGRVGVLLERADQVAAQGNLVRAAILRMRAARLPDCRSPARVRGRAGAALDRLVDRLRPALRLDSDEAAAWRQALRPLLEPAARGSWSVAARVLYDLQKVCVDHERQHYRLRPLGWLLSRGRQPLRQPLPHQCEVLVVEHLHSAARRLGEARLGEADRRRLAALLRVAVQEGEMRLRGRLRPSLEAALDQVGLQAANYPERVARHKVVEEVLDQVTARGFVAFGDLRDALSRNQLKMSDLAGPGELVWGDPLLRADHALAESFAGIYRHGEAYLRALQRFSALGFGTRPGRFLTRFLVLPFGGAFVALVGIEEVLEKVAGVHAPLTSVPSVGLLGLFILLLVQVPAFRALVLRLLRLGYRGLRALFLELPTFLLCLPWVRALRESLPVELLRRYALKPLLLTGLSAGTAWLVGLRGPHLFQFAAGSLVAAGLFFNTRPGRLLEEAFADWLALNWNWLRSDILPGLFRFVMYVFRRFVEGIERVLYTVDEWLRFRSGQSRVLLGLKAVLTPVWALVDYVVRFCVTVLIEPQINPVKHFPVVTVSHKLLLPLVPYLGRVLEATLGMDAIAANSTAFTVLGSIPGVFGFLVWELKENWRLYEANRPRELRPVVIGSHGETMLRFMKPGIHSGTLPKLYARLRKAARRGDEPTVHKLLEARHHVEESIRQFVEREFGLLLAGSRGWELAPPWAGEVEVGSNRVQVDLYCPELSRESLRLVFEEQAGWLLAGVERAGWLTRLTPGRARVLAVALAGLYKLAGVDVTRQQVARCLGPEAEAYDLVADGLLVWPGDDYRTEVLYRFSDRTTVRPVVLAGSPRLELPVLESRLLCFRSVPITWREWVAFWEADQAGTSTLPEFLTGVYLLPPGAAVSG